MKKHFFGSVKDVEGFSKRITKRKKALKAAALICFVRSQSNMETHNYVCMYVCVWVTRVQMGWSNNNELYKLKFNKTTTSTAKNWWI